MNSSGDLVTEARKRYVELNLLRNTTKQQTQTLLTHTINGEDQGTTNSERPEAIPTSNDGLMPLPNECLPREGGDPSITQDKGAFGNGSPPSRGRQNKESYLQDEALGVRTILRDVLINNLPTFGAMIALYFIMASFSVLLTISIGYVIAHHLVYTETSALIQFVFLLTAIGVSIGIFSIIRTIVFARFEGSIIYHVQSIIMKRLFSLPISFFEQHSTGDLCHRVLMIEPLARLSGQNQIGVLLSFTFSTIGFLTMLYFAWQLTLTTLAIVSVYLVFFIINIKKQLPLIEKYMSAAGDAAAFTFNMNSGMSRIRVFCSDVFAESRWAKLYSETRQHLSHIYRIGIWRFTITSTIFLFTLMIVFFLATRWERNHLSLEHIIIFYSAFIQFMCGLISFSMQLNELAFTVCAFRRLKPILQTCPEENSSQSDAIAITGTIFMNNIRFSYPQSKLLILDGLTCSVAKGEHVAIVGLSGAGKSTLLKLLMGFYTPQQGQLLFDGEPIQHFNLSEFRQQIGVVFQDSKLMTGTLLTNIIDGCVGLTEEDAWHAADLVGLKAFITSLPMKMHTMVSQQLNVLSGGQKQLISIARALVGKPRLLLLDEATNSLDATAQHHIANVIRRLPITCISISHRLSTIQYADKIMVLHKGRIIEEGTYSQLLQTKGLFYQLAKTQKLHRQGQENATI